MSYVNGMSTPFRYLFKIQHHCTDPTCKNRFFSVWLNMINDSIWKKYCLLYNYDSLNLQDDHVWHMKNALWHVHLSWT